MNLKTWLWASSRLCVCFQIRPQRACIHHYSCQLWTISQTGLSPCVGSSTASCCLAFRASMRIRWRRGTSTRWGNLNSVFVVSSLGLCKVSYLVLQVFRFVQNLIGCEEQARVFKEEVRSLRDWSPYLSSICLNVENLSVLTKMLFCSCENRHISRGLLVCASLYFSLYIVD